MQLPRTGDEALAVYRTKGPEIGLVVLDIGMPGMGGQRYLDELLKLNPEATVLEASGHAYDEMVQNPSAPERRSFWPSLSRRLNC